MGIDLSVEDVTKNFGDFTAVRDVSFTVEQGRFFSILGPSGCGKTTLLRMISGFFEPTSGTIAINGRATTIYPASFTAVGKGGFTQGHNTIVFFIHIARHSSNRTAFTRCVTALE